MVVSAIFRWEDDADGFLIFLTSTPTAKKINKEA